MLWTTVVHCSSWVSLWDISLTFFVFLKWFLVNYGLFDLGIWNIGEFSRWTYGFVFSVCFVCEWWVKDKNLILVVFKSDFGNYLKDKNGQNDSTSSGKFFVHLSSNLLSWVLSHTHINRWHSFVCLLNFGAAWSLHTVLGFWWFLLFGHMYPSMFSYFWRLITNNPQNLL